MPRTRMDDLVEEFENNENFIEEKMDRDATFPEPPKKKIYKNGDMVRVASVVAGVLVYADEVSGNKYTWNSYGDIEEVDYADIMRMIKKRQILFKPSAIILDKEVIEQNKILSDLYLSLYTPQEIREVLDLEPNAMRAKIESLPGNVKENLKDIAVVMVDKGTLDSVKKIKILDEIFGTRLFMKISE